MLKLISSRMRCQVSLLVMNQCIANGFITLQITWLSFFCVVVLFDFVGILQEILDYGSDDYNVGLGRRHRQVCRQWWWNLRNI